MIYSQAKNPAKFFVTFGTFALILFVAFSKPAPLDSANLTSTKDTLQSSRLSVNARVDATGTAAGSSLVLIKTAASAPANTISTANLRAQDSITIGTGTYTIVDIVDADEFTVTPVLAAGDADDNDPVYLKSRPRHVVTFSTATAVANGFFQILLPADATNPNDGNPDDQGFDFNTSVDVVGTDATDYDFVTGVATASGGTGCTAPANYHCFEAHYSGAGGVGTAITITIGNTNGTNTPIAPATGTAHTEATADTYTYVVKNFAASSNPESATPTDQTSGKLALIEAVRVTATVDPTINFSIAGIASGQTRCGLSTDVTTTALAVPFGNLTTLDSFYDAAHDLTVSTNASGGYVVTSSENDELSRAGAGVTVIADTPGDGINASETAIDDWDDGATNGFGYSIQNVDAAVVPFEYSTTTGDCTGSTYCAKQFANIAGSDTPQTIFSSTTVASSENAYVCYRVSVGATQAAGDYENQITYTATGTF